MSHCVFHCAKLNYLEKLVEPAIGRVQRTAACVEQHRRHVRHVHSRQLDGVAVATFGGHTRRDKVIEAEHKETLLHILQGALVVCICREWERGRLAVSSISRALFSVALASLYSESFGSMFAF